MDSNMDTCDVSDKKCTDTDEIEKSVSISARIAVAITTEVVAEEKMDVVITKQNEEVKQVETTEGIVQPVEQNENVPQENNNVDLQCVDCEIDKCIMWRKCDAQKLLCNICHLKRIKTFTQQSGINIKNNSSNNSTNGKGKEIQAVRISSRKNKSKKKFTNNGVAGERIAKNVNNKNRRNHFKKKPTKAADGLACIISSHSVYHNGILFQIGDIVCTNDIDGDIYFAQLRGFLQDDYCEKSVVVTWLLPTVARPKHFDPLLFIPGLDEDAPRPMECFDFVCRAPTDLFKSRLLHTPYLRSQSNLDNLIYAVKCIDKEGITSDTIIIENNIIKNVAMDQDTSQKTTLVKEELKI